MHDKRDRWVLPEGVEEVLPPGAERLERNRRQLLDVFASWGYELVNPPFIEYLESLLTGTGRDLDLQTFKLIDQLTGRLMGIRADMTPQVARIDAHHLGNDLPVRLCYVGTVLRTLPDAFSGSRCPMQVGAELYGHAGVESDCEVLCLMLEVLRASGVAQLHVDVGHVGVFRGLSVQAGLDESQEAILFEALQRKARAELLELLSDFGVADPVAAMIVALVDLNGGQEVLTEAKTALRAGAQEVQAALQTLEQLTLSVQAASDAPLHFDLAELRGYHYHTGLVFAAFVPGQGQMIARGGRYDDVGKVFGRARPATGFSTDLKVLTSLGSEDSEGGNGRILAPWCDDPGLHRKVAELRAHGNNVLYQLPGQSADAQEMRCAHALEYKDGRWSVVDADTSRLLSIQGASRLGEGS